jgi:hypothetical protein
MSRCAPFLLLLIAVAPGSSRAEPPPDTSSEGTPLTARPGGWSGVPAPNQPFDDITVVRTEDLELDVGGLAQLLGVAQDVNDPYKDHDRVYLFMQTARLRMEGQYKGFGFNLELAMGGEDLVVTPTDVALGLLDLSFNVPLPFTRTTYLKVGQFKVPYGREQLTYAGNTQLDGPSIENLGFIVGEDVGAAVVSNLGSFTFIGGVFTGGGRDVPGAHYLPEKLACPLLVARAGVGNVDGDPFYLHQTSWSVDHIQGAFFVNGLFTKDSLIGHSTVLNVKLADKSLLLDSNWNPYIAQAPFSQGEWWQAGADAALRLPLGRTMALAGELQGDWGGYSNAYGDVHMAGGRAQAGLLVGPVAFTARYAFLVPNGNFSSSGQSITGGNTAMQEVTPGFTWYIRGEQLKLIADVPLLINDVVFTEKGVGTYVGSEQPDQSSILSSASNVAGRQTVTEGRLMFQAQF